MPLGKLKKTMEIFFIVANRQRKRETEKDKEGETD